MQAPFEWDKFSDQAYQIKDREYKKKMRKSEWKSILKTTLTALFILPISLVLMPFVKRKEIDSSHFFSMGVDFQREPKATQTFIEELEMETLLLRFKLWEMNSLESLKLFLEQNSERKIILKIMQNRENIEDLELFKKNMRTIFNSLNGLVDIYEIGTTINRAKWGFFSVDEYNRFYKTAYDLKTKEFPNTLLIGSGVIDFEYHFTAHTLFNFFKYHYDGVASLLYVDRRGAPENTQLGFTLSDKIAWLSTMVWLSPKTEHSLHITETNWPISNTAPFAPTSEYECVNEELYSDYMLRYHFLAFASQQVETLSWHQLIAAGYGLIDNREDIHKRGAFYDYKFMLKTLKTAQFLRLDIKRGYYILQCLVDNRLLQIHWSLKETTLKNEDFFTVYEKSGKLITDKTLNIGSSPIYIYIKDAV